MGVFNKINEKSGLIAGVIVVALILFIAGELFMGSNSFFEDRTSVGKIEGNKITQQEYSTMVDQQARSMGGFNDYNSSQIHNQVWSYFVLKYAYPEQYEKLGLEVSDEELEDLVSGKNLWEQFKNAQMFPNFQDSLGQFSRKKFDDWKKQIDKDPKAVEWFEGDLKKYIREDRLRAKYQALFQKAVYVTKEEAQREYKAQNTKAEVKYLYIPYTSIPDSAVKVSDDEIADFLKRHEKEYKREERASIEYVTFQVKPTTKDTMDAKSELVELKKDFETAESDSAFVFQNTENPVAPVVTKLGDLSEGVKSVGSLEKGKVYGPVAEFGKFKLFKVSDVVEDPKDTMYYASTKHILFKTQGKSPEEQAAVKQKAEEVLAQIKTGGLPVFDEMQLKYSEDNPENVKKGGEYKWFPKGQMVKSFEEAAFGAKSTGLVPKLVETTYGYHILWVTDTKSNKKYKIASIEREILTEEGKTKTYDKAFNFASGAKDSESFKSLAQKDSTPVYKFDNLNNQTTYISPKQDPKNYKPMEAGNLQNPRELVIWSLSKGDEGDVSPVFTVGDKYVIATVVRKEEKGTAKPEDIKDDQYIMSKVYAEKKAKIIIDSLNAIKGDLEKKGQAYGPTAMTGTALDVTLGNGSIQGIGYDPTLAGTVFGLVKGKRTVPLQGENGVAILQLVNLTEAPAIADYTSYKTTLSSGRESSVLNDVDAAIREKADIEDNRMKFNY